MQQSYPTVDPAVGVTGVSGCNVGVVDRNEEKPPGAVLGLQNSLLMCKTGFNFKCNFFSGSILPK